jgi:ribosomal protein L11 methyltransferase
LPVGERFRSAKAGSENLRDSLLAAQPRNRITPAMSTNYFVWRKLSQAKWDDAWQERLGWLGQRLIIVAISGKKTTRVEAWQVTKDEADALLKEFGGQVRPMKPMTVKDLEPVPRPPLRIRGKFVVVSSEKERAIFQKKDSKTACLLIPASMAFGTGEHATTATCLRLLADHVATLPNGWSALDLGTGTGILAFAAKMLGAKKVEGTDHDATAVEVAKENAQINQIEGIVFKKSDVLKWTPKKTWPLVTANLFSPILIAAAPQISAAVEKGGILILSGILRIQADEVVAAFKKQKMKFEVIAKKGKWVTCLARK